MGVTIPSAAGEVKENYEISNSLRFNDNDSASLSRAFSTDPSDQKLTTISFWFKIGNITSAFRALYRFNDGSNTGAIYLRSGNDLQFAWDVSSGTLDVRPDGVLRDPSAWYHCHIKVDTTQGTAANRVIIHINGVERSYGTATYPNQNATLQHLSNGKTYYVGGSPPNSDYYFDGYVTEFHVIDGQAKDYTDFGEFDDNGVWIPKRYTGTYGNNGFYLEFKQTGTSANSSGIGADTSGNDLHWTPSNLAGTDITTDTCTNNYCTLNSIRGAIGSDSSNSTLSEGNLKSTGNNGDYKQCEGTIFPESGKWYWETLIVSDGSDAGAIGIQRSGLAIGAYPGKTANGYGYDSYGSGSKIHNNSRDNSYGSSFAANDIIGTLLDLDNGTLTFYKNNSSQGQAYSGITSSLGWGFGFGDAYGTVIVVNFGQEGSFAGNKTASGNSDANGYGDFFYSVPSGYYALNTKNLAEFG